MKVGDLVKCRNDEKAIWGMGLVVAEETRKVKVFWSEPVYSFDPQYQGNYMSSTPVEDKDDWLWKTNLEIISEA